MTLSCKKAAQLISDSMDRRLSLRERGLMGFHLMVCNFCRRYRRQLQIMGRMLREIASAVDGPEGPSRQRLSQVARDRIARALGIPP